jgi:hypothetical protein
MFANSGLACARFDYTVQGLMIGARAGALLILTGSKKVDFQTTL